MTIFSALLLSAAAAGIVAVTAATASSLRYLGLMKKQLFSTIVIFQILALLLFVLSIFDEFSGYPTLFRFLFAMIELLYTAFLFFKYVKYQLSVPALYAQALPVVGMLAADELTATAIAIAVSFFFAAYSTISVAFREDSRKSNPYVVISFIFLDFSIVLQGL